MLVCAFLVSPGLFNIDEFVVLAGAKAFLAGDAFAVQNGWPAFRSPDLNLWLLIPGPRGLAPQYPPGSAVLGAPLLALFGPRGLMLINVLAAIGTLAALWALASRHFGGAAVALVSVLLLAFATFWFEYAYAIWPHSVGILAVTVALLLLMDCLDRDDGVDLKALAAGLVIGAGLLFRTDTALAVPALGLVTILCARRPFRIGAAFALGLAPFVALAAGANLVKFGTLNPLSYGHSTAGAAVSLSSHLGPIGMLALAGALLIAARLARWRPRPRDHAVGLTLVALVLAASGAARDGLLSYVQGAWALLADATTLSDARPGVIPLPGGVVSFWGFWKKALGQSMPWLGLLVLAIPAAARDKGVRRLSLIVLVLFAVWSLPFFLLGWHGGMSGDMRYLLPVVPALCALSARVLVDFARPIPDAPRVLLVGGVAAIAAIVLWTALHPTRAAGAHQILSSWTLALVAALAVLSTVRWRGQAGVRTAGLAAIGCGLTAAMLFLVADFRQIQAMRAGAESYSARTADLPERTLVYAPPTHLSRWSLEPGRLTAMPALDGTIDTDLIDQVLGEGYRVLIWRGSVTDALRSRYGARLRAYDLPSRGGEFLEVEAAS